MKPSLLTAMLQEVAQMQTLLMPLLTERLRIRLEAIASFFDPTREGTLTAHHC